VKFEGGIDLLQQQKHDKVNWTFQEQGARV
jgi:hypothetical protein